MNAKIQAIQVTEAFLEAMGVPKQVGLPASVCVARLLDVEAFMDGGLEKELQAASVRIAELERGEFICKKCGLRKDSDHEKGDF